jgi:3-deoxy-7-phosphoheptulonate synthase / chorismate mutase
MESAGNTPSRPEPLDGLAALRVRIDEIDLGILRLIEQRGRVVEEILRLKQARGRPVLDEARERQLLDRLQSLHLGPHDWPEVELVFRQLLAMSRGLAR